LKRFRIVLVNRRVGLLAEELRWAVDADDLRSAIDQTAPDCEIVELDLIDT